jgi:hypothetical protein
MSNNFFEKIKEKMLEIGSKSNIEFRSEDDIADQLLIQSKEETAKLEEKKKKLLEIASCVEAKIKLRVETVTQDQFNINQQDIIDDMEKTMVLHSKLIEDVFDFQRALEELKVVHNSLVCLLHHGYKFKNKLKIKGAKELDTYISSDYAHNEINIKIKKIQALIERGNSYSRLIDRKIGFIKEVAQTQRARMYKESKDNA